MATKRITKQNQGKSSLKSFAGLALIVSFLVESGHAKPPAGFFGTSGGQEAKPSVGTQGMIGLPVAKPGDTMSPQSLDQACSSGLPTLKPTDFSNIANYNNYADNCRAKVQPQIGAAPVIQNSGFQLPKGSIGISSGNTFIPPSRGAFPASGPVLAPQINTGASFDGPTIAKPTFGGGVALPTDIGKVNTNSGVSVSEGIKNNPVLINGNQPKLDVGVAKFEAGGVIKPTSNEVVILAPKTSIIQAKVPTISEEFSGATAAKQIFNLRNDRLKQRQQITRVESAEVPSGKISVKPRIAPNQDGSGSEIPKLSAADVPLIPGKDKNNIGTGKGGNAGIDAQTPASMIVSFTEACYRQFEENRTSFNDAEARDASQTNVTQMFGHVVSEGLNPGGGARTCCQEVYQKFEKMYVDGMSKTTKNLIKDQGLKKAILFVSLQPIKI